MEAPDIQVMMSQPQFFPASLQSVPMCSVPTTVRSQVEDRMLHNLGITNENQGLSAGHGINFAMNGYGNYNLGSYGESIGNFPYKVDYTVL